MSSKQHCILFYKYHPLTSSADKLEHYRAAHEKLCTSLNLTGRILIGLSEEGEGINGTLAGGKNELSVYVNCMLGRDYTGDDAQQESSAATFRNESKAFFETIHKPELIFASEADFKWSSRSTLSAQDTPLNKEEETWFPDLNIKLVKEIISTGGVFSNITAKETSVGYLTPKEWHEEMKLLQEQANKAKDENSDGKDVNVEPDTVLIDVRNHKECQIGTFLPGVAIDPNTKTFSQFPKWVKDHSAAVEVDGGLNVAAGTGGVTSLENKKILLYCTGGIRCEKASAYVRQIVPKNKGVYHLKGGIHKYLEEFGKEDCKFVGKNFVFDRRGAMRGVDCLDGEEDKGDGENVVGRCLYCAEPHDTFLPENVCTVCREPVLVCPQCVVNLSMQQKKQRGVCHDSKEQKIRVELHCEDHFQMKTCYFTSLYGFSLDDLSDQIQQLQVHSRQFEGIGKKGKQKRRTIRKQIQKIEAFISTKDEHGPLMTESELQCRNCGCATCAGDCWGFHGGNARMINKEKAESIVSREMSCVNNLPLKERTRTRSNHRPAKRLKRQKELCEVERLQLCKLSSEYRLPNKLRVPPPCVRVISSSVKGRWCGKTLKSVMSAEFQDFADLKGDRLNEIINSGLLRINGTPVSKVASERLGSFANASDILLRNMDTVERIVHWHEPPICVPESIFLTKHSLPDTLFGTASSTTSNEVDASNRLLYCINKPSSVPVHPAGPYYANSLLLMVEAQENLAPKSLIPCHRIDKCTSGILLCTNDSDVARAVQGAMTSREPNIIKKLYLARVKGKFPSSTSDGSLFVSSDGFTSHTWHGDTLEVNAPIAVQLSRKDRAMDTEESCSMMHRAVAPDGKNATSRFKLLSYDPNADQSLVSCCPITGRGHQLRVHLQFIGHPIHNDVEYGGIIDTEFAKEQKEQSVQAMLDATNMSSLLQDESVSIDEAKAAVETCKCCCGGDRGISASFHTAQLLGGGHMIDLHAYKYSICFKQKRTKDSCDQSTKIEFSASLPSWVSDFTGTLSEEIGWLA